MKGIGLILVLLLVVGCATTPKLSSMQVRQITTKDINGSYENIYRATMTVLQDEGYIIKNTDMDSGLIVADIDRETSRTTQFLQQMAGAKTWDKGTQIQISAMVNKINDDLSKLRINIQEINYNQHGGKSRITQIREEKVYYDLFNTIITEVRRREAMKQ
ncbi:MAG: hypothetical protein HQ558_04390 [Candidatus Omnitrophica bacterium]|nr:hypothetical protein [Candidatus Omnitrophota bacterium]